MSVLEIARPYPRRVVGQLTNLINRSLLRQEGGVRSGQRLRGSDVFGEGLSGYPISEGELVEAGRFNTNLPAVAGVLLLEGSQKNAYIDRIGGMDVKNLVPVAASMVLEGPVAIRTVYGATTEMPFRAISGIVPPLEFLSALKAVGAEVQFQVVSAHNISSEYNCSDPEAARQQFDRFARAARLYIANFFPEVKQNTVFLQDKPLGQVPYVAEEIKEATRVMSSVLSENTKEKLKSKGDNNGGNGNDKLYGAAHLVIHDRFISRHLEPVFNDQPEQVKPEAIISIGGVQEMTFYSLRHEVKPHLPGDYREIATLQYFSRHAVPPYYLARGGERTLLSVIQNSPYGGQTDKAAEYDLDYLRRVSNSRGDYEGFIAELRRLE